MVWKKLTSITELEAEELANHLMVDLGFSRLEAHRYVAEMEGKYILKLQTLKFVNVQRLMMMSKAIEALRLLPYLTPPEYLKVVAETEAPIFKEDELLVKGVMKLAEVARERLLRREEVREAKVTQEVRRRLLTPISLNLIEQEAFALLEKYFYVNFHDQFLQCVQKVIKMSEAKQIWCERITGLDAMQKAVLQMYCVRYMGVPKMSNIISVRCSPVTMELLKDMTVCMYAHLSGTGQGIKPKSLLMSATKRVPRTKSVSSGKPRAERVVTKGEGGITTKLTKETEISLFKDFFGSDLWKMAILYAYGMPYSVKMWFMRHIGFPENRKFWSYSYISLVPTRRMRGTLWRIRIPKERQILFNRDAYLKIMKKYGSRYRSGYAY